MTSLNLHNLLLGTLSLAFVACDVPDPEAVQERGYNSNMSSGECPPWECGFNSAEVNGRAIRELNLDGAYNDDGMRIVGFIAPAGLLGSYKLDVQNDELVAVGKYKTLRGKQLIGATLLVKPSGLLKPATPIVVAGYSEVQSWAAGGAPVPSYALLYPDVDAVLGQRNVCVGDLKNIFTTAAVILGGETYDLDSKTVNADQDRWVTIACAGSAAAKLRLMNYGPQSDFDGQGNPASVDQRQATLKMLTADYCGDGTSYTANGTPLAWENAEGTVATTTKLGAREAVWTADGALCLEATRLADAEVACNLPACDSLGDPLAAGEWLTHLPLK